MTHTTTPPLVATSAHHGETTKSVAVATGVLVNGTATVSETSSLVAVTRIE